MPFEFRDVALALEERDEQFKVDRGTAPCVTCDDTGQTEDASGNAISAIVEGEPDRVWVLAYGDSIPFIVLNKGRINPQSNVPVWVGYLEDSVEREVLGVNQSQLDIDTDSSSQYGVSSQAGFISRSQFPILKTTAGGLLTVDVSALEYDRFGGYTAFQGQSGVSLTSSVPAANFKVKALVYLSTLTGLIVIETGVSVQDLPGNTAVTPDTPPDGIASAVVSLVGGQTVISTSDIAEAKRITTPNTISGMVYNNIPRSVDVPADYTYLRGATKVEQSQYLKIHDGGRVRIL